MNKAILQLLRCVSREQIKECFWGIAVYSVCFLLVSWFFGTGFVAIIISGMVLIFFLESRKEYSGCVVKGMFWIIGTIFTAIVLIEIKYLIALAQEIAWMKFYFLGMLMSYSFMILFGSSKIISK